MSKNLSDSLINEEISGSKDNSDSYIYSQIRNTIRNLQIVTNWQTFEYL